MGEYSAEVWRKLHRKELHYFYSLPGVIKMIRSTTIRRVGM